MTVVNGSNFSPYSSAPTNSVMGSNSTLLKDDFLKLLIVQLKNQDPLSPVDDSQFLSQLAQFSSLEQMGNIAQSVEELNKNMTWLSSQSLLTQGAAMIGKEGVGIDKNGQQVSGLISSVKWNGDTLQVAIGDELIDMENIIEIRQADTAPLPNGAATEQTSNDEPDSQVNTDLDDDSDTTDTTDTTDTGDQG